MPHSRILVLDGSTRQALTACRVLGRLGHVVGVAGYGRSDVARYSRYADRYHRLPDPSGPGEPFRLGLDGALAEGAYEALIASDDATLARLVLAKPHVPTVPSLGPALERLTDKIGLASVCAAAAVSYPRTLPINGEHDARAVLAEATYPLVVKAARSAVASEAAVHQRKGATVANDQAEALRASEVLRADGLAPVAQERIERHEKINVAIVRSFGRSHLRFAHRSIRDVPPSGGSAAALESIDPGSPPGSSALDVLERVCDVAGYEGLAQAECIVSDGGQLYLIEVNPRPWASLWFAERLGLGVVECALRSALGLRPLPRRAYQFGRRFHHLPSEWRWWRMAGGARQATVELARTTRPWDVFEPSGLFDPRPLLHYALDAPGARSTANDRR